MQSDIMQPQKSPQTVTNSVPVAQAPTQPNQQAGQPMNMDIKNEQPKAPAQSPKTLEKPAKEKKKKEKSRSNIGIIIFACLICAALVGLAIYVKIQNTPVPQ